MADSDASLEDTVGGFIRAAHSDGAASCPGAIGPYTVLGRLGEGGFGTVFLAEEETTKRKVAVKLLHPSIRASEQAAKRFQREVSILRGQYHDNVVSLRSCGTHEGSLYYAMEYVEGVTLAQLIATVRRTLREKAVPLRKLRVGEFLAPLGQLADLSERLHVGPLAGISPKDPYYVVAVRIAKQVAGALIHLHRQGVVHRDVKPANIMLTRNGRAILMDFGISSDAEATRLTRTRQYLGTARYSPPEHLLGEPAGDGTRADLYSLAATLYEMLCLTPMYEGTTPEHERELIRQGRPPQPEQLNPALPSDLVTIIMVATARFERDRHYRNARQLAADLQAFEEHKPISARPLTPWYRLRCAYAANPSAARVAIGAAFALAAIVAAFVVLLVGQDRRAREAEAKRQRDASRRASVASAQDPPDGAAPAPEPKGSPRAPAHSPQAELSESLRVEHASPAPGSGPNEAALAAEEQEAFAAVGARTRRMQEIKRAIREATGGLVDPDTADPSRVTDPGLRQVLEEYQGLGRQLGLALGPPARPSVPVTPERRPAPAPEKPVESPKRDTSYRAYVEWQRQRGMPISDGPLTVDEYVAFVKWREAQEAAVGKPKVYSASPAKSELAARTLAPAPERPVEPAKPDTSYRAYLEWRRQRGMPGPDSSSPPTESELAAYHRWREAKANPRPLAPEPAKPVVSEEQRLAATIAENERLTVTALRTYAQAQEKFHGKDWYRAGDRMYANPIKGRGFPDLRSCRGRSLNLIGREFAAATSPGRAWNGYWFVDITRFVDGSRHKWTSTFGLCAVPAKHGRTGIRTFIVDWGPVVKARDNGGKPVRQFPHPRERWRFVPE